MSDRRVFLIGDIVRRFLWSIRGLLSSSAKWRAIFLMAALTAQPIAISGLNVVNSYVNRDFMTALSVRNHSEFVRQAVIYLAVFAASTIVAVFQRFAEERFGLLWRDWLTRRLTASYLSDRTYYWLKALDGIDNPDQRITDDVRAFVTTSLSFFLIGLNGVLTVAAFAGVLWTISPLLLGVAIGYAALGTVATFVLGWPLIALNDRQFDREANFRSELIHLRDNAESVAAIRCEPRLAARLSKRITSLVTNFRKMTSVNRNVGFFTNGYTYLMQIIPILITAPLYFRGQVEFGVITQSLMAFETLLGAFSLIVNQFQSISAFAAVVGRIGALGEAVESAKAFERQRTIEDVEDGERIEYEKLTLRSPDSERLLINGLKLAIEPGTRLLVTGGSEEARIALFRATAGIWRWGDGRIIHPPVERLRFVPQRPYLPRGTLRELLVPPDQEERYSDDDLLALLNAKHSGHLVERAGGFSAERDWGHLFSLGEQQKLSLVRVLLEEPAFVYLDRIHTTVGQAHVAEVLDLLTSHGITPVVFAESTECSDHFDAVLHLSRGGAWRRESMTEYAQTA